ncbi:hypothetical protein [Acinetobacter junii]|uniref:hypothetical protein n=1 Tax=Acinetobacter junii TaxID=40215 RepID=UPI002447F693|nr:hypothetical protein [Acinetobacter junii]MDH1004152.1 hypothetical protein [Acinetobacter junii]
MKYLTDDEQNSFISNLDNSLWFHWFLIVGDVVKFYSLQETNEAVVVSQDFLIDLLKYDEDNIELFRNKFKKYIKNNNGEFRSLGVFPEYFHPRDKKIRNIEVDVIRVKLMLEQDEGIRNELLKKLNKFEELDNPEYKALTKIQEAENCFFWAIRSLRLNYKNEKMKDFIGLPRAMFLHGYACGLLGIDSGVYTKLNEDKTAQEKGGEVLKNKAQLAELKLIYLWKQRFNNSELTAKEKINMTSFARYILRHPSLICDSNGIEIKDSEGNPWYGVESTITRKLGNFEKTCKG